MGLNTRFHSLRRREARCPLGCTLLLLAVAALALGGCSGKKTGPSDFARKTPPPFEGPAFLQGSVSSYAALTNSSSMLVSGYGVVVGLAGTGSNIVSPELRPRVMDMLRRGGVSNPSQFLASPDTAVVVVEALIPPGATRNMPIDLLVSTRPQSMVSSLAGGRLWSTDLSLMGTEPSMFNRTLAVGRGPLYVNPFDTSQGQERTEARQAVVVGGGTVTEDRVVELILRQANFRLAREISDRINERFPRQPARFRDDPLADSGDIADPKSDSVIRLHMPKRYANDPQRLLNLIMHLYLERGPGFEEHRTRELADLLKTNAAYAEHVVPAWEALGRDAVPGLRDHYQSDFMHVRLASLEAGAHLGDLKAIEPLVQLAASSDPRQRRQAAVLLGYLSNPRVLYSLRKLVDDDDVNVRLDAYASLAALGNGSVRRTVFESKTGLKFTMDLVESNRPMVYIAQAPFPRVVIFDPMLGFRNDQLVTLWDGQLMLRREGEHQLKVFYQRRGAIRGDTWPDIAPAVANLVVLLGHQPSLDRPLPGADMDFGQVANVLYTLWKQGHIPADMHLQLNPLAARLAVARQMPSVGPRREFGDEAAPAEVPPGDAADVESDSARGNNDGSLGFRDEVVQP